MMKPRQQEGGLIVAPAYQYGPTTMLYISTQEHWSYLNRDQLTRCIRNALPSGLREGWPIICSGEGRKANEQDNDPTTRWIERNQWWLGFRPPTIQERDRVPHNKQYLAQLGLHA